MKRKYKLNTKVKKVQNVKKVDNKESIRKLYSIPAHSVNGAFMSTILLSKSSLVRITFTEIAMDIKENFPVVAVNMPIENLQQLYNVMGQILQNARENKRID